MIHGHHSTYSRQGCRCEPCRIAHAVYSRKRLQAKRDGQPYMRPTTKARRHLRVLLAAGLRMVELERAMGVSNPRVKAILNDPNARVYASTEEKILSTSQADVYEHCREVPSAIPSRMLRTLAAVGWGPGDIARVASLNVVTIQNTRDKPRPRVYRETAELIGKAYDYMLTLPRPEGHNANQQRSLARRKGWPKPVIGDHWKKAS